MKILLVNDFFFPHMVGGTETFLRALALGLQAKGHEVAIVTARVGSLPRRENLEGLDISRLGHFPPFEQATRQASGTAAGQTSPALMAEFTTVVGEFRPDVVHFHNLWLLGPKLMSIEGVRKGVLLHDYWPFCLRRSLVRVDGRTCPGPGWLACRLCRLRAPATLRSLDLVNIERERQNISSWLKSCHFCVAASNFVASRVQEFSGVRVRVIPMGVEAAPEVGKPIREEFVLYAGRISALKGIGWLTRAFSHPALRERQLWIAGEMRTPRQGNIRVLGWQSREALMDLMSRAACVVVPSLWPEPFGLVALEAQRLGTPVVASRVGGLAELVDDGKTGILVPPGDVQALVNGILFACDPHFQSTTRREGPKFVRENYSFEKTLNKWESVYAESV
jgi:glycosyltransferase involved in cell wall biosynthesis